MPPKPHKAFSRAPCFYTKKTLQIHFKRDGSGRFQFKPKRKTKTLTLHIGRKLS